LARAAKVIAIDKSAAKFETAEKCGADVCIDASAGNVTGQLLEATSGRGVDVTIDFVSNASTLEPALAAAARGARVVTLGGNGQPVSVNAAAMLRNEIEFIGSRYATRQEVANSRRWSPISCRSMRWRRYINGSTKSRPSAAPRW
jgi:threonine dehydrogenase-like Zn-dependent dehydrogenase